MSTAKNAVLQSMVRLLHERQPQLLAANVQDLNAYQGGERAMYDRLVIDDKKVAGMIRSVETVLAKPDPVGSERYRFEHPEGMLIENRTAPFGTILIIYESRPDVTIEAAVLAFKAGNKILLKGGKEAHHSNRALVALWHAALLENDFGTDWIQYLPFNRSETQAFLKNPDRPVDLIVPRGGERLIQFVKQEAQAPVLVSGRGNNFLYVHHAADWSKVLPIILNAKTHKISACNALDKILIDAQLPHLNERLEQLVDALRQAKVAVWTDRRTAEHLGSATVSIIEDEAIWYEEFLSMKVVIGLVEEVEAAIVKINRYSGGHSVSILTEDAERARDFMFRIDAAAVFHNASTRFTDGGEFGLGAELAISTDKLHHRGPLGLEHLVSNKWLVYGDGQIRTS